VYQTSDATGPVTLKAVLCSVATPELPVPEAVASAVRFDPMAALHPLKVKIPWEDEEGVQLVVEVPTFTEMVPA
jgi:hypothetical protein